MNRRGFMKSVLGSATVVAIPSTIMAALATKPPSRGFPAYGTDRTWWSPTHSTLYSEALSEKLSETLRSDALAFAKTAVRNSRLYPWQERVLEAVADAHANGKKLTVTWPPRRPRCICPTP